MHAPVFCSRILATHGVQMTAPNPLPGKDSTFNLWIENDVVPEHRRDMLIGFVEPIITSAQGREDGQKNAAQQKTHDFSP